MHVAVIYSTPTRRMLATPFGATDSDTETIAQAVAEGLEAKGIATTIHPVSEDNISEIANLKADCLFNLVEWTGLDIGLEKQTFHYLRQLNIPVTGCSERVYCLTADKVTMKEALKSAGLSIPAGTAFVTGLEQVPPDIKYPVLVKPATEHCSTGLGYDTLANNKEELLPIVQKQIQTFHQPVIAEEFIQGREFEVYLLEEKGQVRVLPIEEVIFKDTNPFAFQTYSAKWEEDSLDYQTTDVVVAKLNAHDLQAIEKICLQAFQAIGFWGYARFDLRLRDGQPYLLETNANPAVYDDTDPLVDPDQEVIWGIKFSDYVQAIVDAACSHYRRGDTV